MYDQQTLLNFHKADEPDDSETKPPSQSVSSSVGVNTTIVADLPDQYHRKEIASHQEEKRSYELCTPDGTVAPSFTTVAGSGGMGPQTGIDSPHDILSLTEELYGTPIVVNGGGMNVAGSGGPLFGQLRDTELVKLNTSTRKEKAPHSVRVTCKPLYRPHGSIRRDERKAVIGSYTLAVPTTHQDAVQAAQALSAWMNETVEYLDPQAREAARRSQQLVQTLANVAPGDTIQTPIYETPLTVISEQYEAHVRIPKITEDDTFKSISSVVVDNPRGGTYQFGFQNKADTTPPTCHLSSSQSTPPKPNTAFRGAEQFSAADIEVTTGNTDLKPTKVVGPDEEVQQSPLPKPCLRTQLSDIDNVGPKASREAFKKLKTTDAHRLAHNLYGSGTDIAEADIVRAFDGHPSKKIILTELKEIAADLS